MRRVDVRTPVCALCGAPGKRKGGVRSETNPRVFYERHWVCSNPKCVGSRTPQSAAAFEGIPRAFGERGGGR